MSLRVFKYNLGINPRSVTILAPMPAQTLNFGNQDDAICVWLIVDDGRLMVEKTYHLVETGKEVPADSIYVGTVASLFENRYVLHVFEGPNK